ncbi:phosphatase [Flavipsychrobacter stenotrophus]|uniref:Phosphatase n=1 Tax=Flavipsychrobacter stenotrophus TaxID=2077091 RepID=A0A2S7SVS5_9BACT|nr:macro domain-containing protein [Flavipsychrobacter stenotrophus]PQJ10717.1 phosphatase [Flavipsychrobacter stenotrophus]
MLHFVTGDLLQSTAQALVNTVNTVGVMGKGIALQFKENFPANNMAYVEACKQKLLVPGQLLLVSDKSIHYGVKSIINFPTKVHWKSPSKYEYIEDGLLALRKLILEKGIQSIAIPPLGCGNGGLDWDKVKPMISDHLGDLDIEIQVYEPNAHIKQILQSQDVKKESRLTPARAQLLYMLYAYESLGEYSSLFAANKLAYFLQRMGQPLKLNFHAHHYGPYALGVEKVLYSLNGIYLRGIEQGQAKAFEPLYLNYGKCEEVKEYIQKEISIADKGRLDKLLYLLTGFTSDLSLEILASVDFILQDHPDFTLQEISNAISQWNDRKKKLFKHEYVEIAYNHLLQNKYLFTS